MFKLLDFAKGYKSLIGAVLLLVTVGLRAKGIDIDSQTLETEIFEVLNETDVLIAQGVLLYGLVMKLIRKFK